MKSNFPHIGLAKLCGWFGITRQAYYQNGWKGIEVSIEEDLVLKEVFSIRKNHKRMGTRKLYEKLHPFMLEHQIKMGRDALFDLLSSNHLLVRKRKRRIQTTQSFHWLRKYPNLIREFIPTGPNQLWVSDITYWKIQEGHVYISFITDAYSRKIVGFHLAETLEAVQSVQALKMALSGLFVEPGGHFQLIHHSDRGVQYVSIRYTERLAEAGIEPSVGSKGDSYDNALAETINGLYKAELIHRRAPWKTLESLELATLEWVTWFNHHRLLEPIGYIPPAEAEDRYYLQLTAQAEHACT